MSILFLFRTNKDLKVLLISIGVKKLSHICLFQLLLFFQSLISPCSVSDRNREKGRG